MVLAFHVLGDHPSLPLMEIESLFSAFGIPLKVVRNEPPLLFVDSPAFSGLSRLAFTHRIVDIAEGGDFINLLDPAKSFRVRCLNLSRKKVGPKAERALADEVQRQFGGRLAGRMRHPGQEVFAFLLDDGVQAGKTIFDFTKTFSGRTPTRRPFFHPSTMHPRLARCLVNLSGALREILDPFCGSGAILVEAGLMGLRAYGMDISESMLSGAKKNLTHFGAGDFVLWRGDACTYSGRMFEAVACDLPYGRSTLLSEKRDSLYRNFFENLPSMTDTAAVVLPEGREDFPGLKCVGSAAVRVHKSLTRHIYILRRPGSP